MENREQPDPELASIGVVEYRILGPLAAVGDSRARALGGRRQRMVLAVLIANANQVVSQDALIEAVWSGEPPEAAKTTLQSYISNLRRELGGQVIRRGDGYLVEVDETTLDAQRFANEVEKGRQLLFSDPFKAVTTLQNALALWYGVPYGDLGSAPALLPDAVHLEELRVSAVEHRIEADLAIGNHRVVVGELETLVREHPYRERLRAMQMQALYRSGRQADALRAYQRLRVLLADELGIDPSSELRALEQRILEQDPTLDLADAIGIPVVESRRSLRGYELRDQVGEGDYGVVFRAFQPSIGREVAIKAIRPEHVKQAAFIRRFEAEAQLIAQLEHPHAVPLFDFWRDPEGAYLVMPLLRGGSLSQSLQRGPWNLAPALRLLDQVGSAVGYAHRQGVTHRDIKPGNVLLDEEGNAYLSDFGVASRLIDEQGSPVTTSLAYLAPEEMRGDPATTRSDIFSLGVLTFHLLTGVYPMARQPLPSVAQARSGMPAALDNVLRKATDDEPANRFEKVDDFLRALRRAVGTDVVTVAERNEPTSHPIQVRNPYKGLRSFLETDALDFYGRDALVDDLLRSLGEHGLVAVVGPSGSGKSSVVRAGLVPALRAGRLPGSRGWLITDMFPGSYPFEELEAALLRVAVDRPTGLIDELSSDDRGLLRATKQILPADDSQLLLIIDQFEELFSTPPSEEVRRLFLESLLVVTGDSRSRIRVLLTMRADFFDRPLSYPAFGEALQAGLVTVGPLAGEGLAQAISGPARRVGVDLEPGLVGTIRAEVEGQPGGLPLLQFALTEMFESRDDGKLTIAAYETTGGVRGALGRRAEELYDELSPAGKEAARQLFLRLVTVDDAATPTRRRVRQSELRTLSVDQPALAQVLQQFGAFRLLSFDRHPITRGPTVEVAHEALLTEWARLARWIDSQRDDLTLHRRVTVSAREWTESNSDPSFLLRGARLEQAEQWISRGRMAVSSEESNFVTASVVQRQADQTVARHRRRNLSVLMLTAFLVMSALAVAAFTQSRRAEREARQAAVWNLAGAATDALSTDPELGVLLALAAIDQSNSLKETPAVALDALAQAVKESRLELTVPGRRGPIDASASLLAGPVTQGSGAGTEIALWDLQSEAPLRTLVGDHQVYAVEFSPDGSRLAVGYQSPRGEPAILIWDPQDGSRLQELTPPLPMHGIEMVWSPEGTLLATIGGAAIRTVTVWAIDSAEIQFSSEAPSNSSIDFLDESTLLVANPAARSIAMHDANSGEVLREISVPDVIPTTIKVEAGGAYLVVGSSETQMIQRWNLDSVELVWSTAPLAPRVDDRLTLDIDAGVVAVSGSDGFIQVLDIDDGNEITTVARHPEPVAHLALVPGSSQLMSAGAEGGFRLWDINPGGPRELSTHLGDGGGPCGVVVSPDGSEVLAWTTDGEILHLELSSGSIIRIWSGQGVDFFSPPAITADWRQAAWVDENGEAWVRDLATDELLTELPACTVPKAFSTDGSLLVLGRADGCADRDGRSKVIEVATGRVVLDLGPRSIVAKGAAFNPVGHFEAGRYLALNMDGTVEIYDMEERGLVATWVTDEWALSLDFDPTGRYLAVGTELGRTRVIDMEQVLQGVTPEQALVFDQVTNKDSVAGLALGADGLVASSSYGSLGVWNINTGELVAEPQVDIDTPPFAAFAPDGGYLVHIDGGFVIRKWFLDPEQLIEFARTRVTRSLTAEECLRYFGPKRCG